MKLELTYLDWPCTGTFTHVRYNRVDNCTENDSYQYKLNNNNNINNNKILGQQQQNTGMAIHPLTKS